MALYPPSYPPTDGETPLTAGNKPYEGIIVVTIFMVFFFISLIYSNYSNSSNFPLPGPTDSSRRRRFSFAAEVPLDFRNMGLDARVVEALPVFEYKAQSFKDELECAVCLSEFEENEKGRFLPNCKHGFHVDCIDMWFHSHSTCPICRTGVEPKQWIDNNNTSENSINVELVSSNSASVQDSQKGKQALTKQKLHDERPSTSGLSSMPETAIDIPWRS